MKTFLIIIGIAVVGVLGYMSEPALRKILVGTTQATAKMPAAETTAPIPPDISSIDPVSLTAEQLPQTVALKIDVKFTDPAAGIELSVSAGSRVKLLRVDGPTAIIAAVKTDLAMAIPIEKTDLLEQLAANPPKAVEPAIIPAVTPAAEPAVTPAEEPAVTPVTEPVPEPAVVPAEPTEPVAAPEVPAVAENTPDPAVAPATQTEPAPQATVPGDVVSIMKASIRDGDIEEFKFEQVLEWKAEADETVDGENFQTGTVSYKAETIFGNKTILAKALVKNGKVQRWIWPKSGIEIK